MNHYPSWIHRIPAMIEAVALSGAEQIDRRMAEQLFDLRKTAAFHLLRRFGATQRGGALVISRTLLMARLREAQENPGWQWESERRRALHERIECLRPVRSRKSQVPLDASLQQQLQFGGLPETVRIEPGLVTIRCISAEDLLRQLVLLVHSADADLDALEAKLETAPRRRAPGSETTAASFIEVATTA